MSQHFGNWSSTVDRLFVEYEFPQESSNRTDVRWVKLSGASEGDAVPASSVEARFGSQSGFSFTASRFTADDLAKSQHPHELHKRRRDYVILHLDADHHGLGSRSCGPRALAKYTLEPAAFDFEIEFR
jgi:beta-galactosidase